MAISKATYASLLIGQQLDNSRIMIASNFKLLLLESLGSFLFANGCLVDFFFVVHFPGFLDFFIVFQLNFKKNVALRFQAKFFKNGIKIQGSANMN